MPKITIKVLQEEIESLKYINELLSSEITKLNREIDDLKDQEKVVSIEEYNVLIRELENQKIISSEYKKMYERLRDETSEKKLNVRNAGRKAYSNKEVIEMIYTLYLSGSSLQAIADNLNYSEIKTKQGKEWAKSSIRFILINSENVSNNLIKEDTYNRAVKLLNDRRKRK